ncbi:MAG: valine--tRNA ligase [Acidimicrobiia bacterium]
MESTYDPAAVESRWYDRWESAGAFRPEVNPDGAPFCIVIPPPNVTGSLHMGHALDLSIQDVIIRRKRMQGLAALWVPGTDHAGIATQNVVERELAAEGLSRHDIGREAFVEQVWMWKERSGGRISEQMRTLGFSVDWTRERFTLDEGLSRAVRQVFVTLYDEGLIYRSNRIINWCPHCRTALSDIEVEHEETLGELVTIRYPFADGEGAIEVATTRAETMLGDTAVAVHPGDERYADAIGREVTLPLMDRRIPVVADAEVDPEFGTGAVKVTPAHDPLDFDIGQRSGLEAIKVIGEDGLITPAGGQFAGMDRFGARTAVKEALAASGALVSVAEHTHSVGHCSRSNDVVEPMLSLQWFVKVEPLVGPAIDTFRNGETRFVPKTWENSYFHWMENLRDWCISRQLWWGHRIPAWYCDACHEVIVARDEPTACTACGAASLRADEDVLDTWFSSALWPFSTLGWPDETEDLKRFYPNSVLVTGYDIIYFWVARMLKMGLHFMGESPYPDVVIHGLVRTADGRKMSKSLNNAVDPLDLAHTYGADALRLTLLQAAAPGHEVPAPQDEWLDAARRFGNKLWNAVRFASTHVDDVPRAGGYPTDPAPEAAWILQRLHEVTQQVDELLDEYRFSDAFSTLYAFAWSEVFDWFIELSKAPLRDPDRSAEAAAVVGVVIRDVLKLFHPGIPFVTEELWSQLVGDGLLATAPWPDPPAYDSPRSMETFQELIVAARRFRAEHGLGPNAELTMVVVDAGDTVEDWWPEQAMELARLSMTFGEAPGEGHTRLVSGKVEGFVALGGAIDVDSERQRLAAAAATAVDARDHAAAKLGNDSFRDRAPADVVAKEQGKLSAAEQLIDSLRAQLEELG